MRAFIWVSISGVSDNYHSSGSVLVIADSIERAREIANYKPEFTHTDEVVHISETKHAPQLAFDVGEPIEEQVWIFPNAGCC